jgi:CheY-like chemotaxis protein
MPVKVLVVDDSVLLHKMYDLALRAYRGCAVESHFASNGREGLVQLQAHPDVQLILLDVNMPTMSGRDRRNPGHHAEHRGPARRH